ncbi:sugar porter family MFS transporter [Planctobacterium marinum]|uniref:Major facilitator superfamily (MFS) profile domain-containing protein n=1 Tax=Planctobacterium marinum TaxID=1631968 RepID=A0AA48KV51_9ALTE|nr:hypothetical protein MACH26_26660 [Planctobacterium marinum]
MTNKAYTVQTAQIALIVALGGFLMGFDASVISGVVKFIEAEFALTKIQLGWAVASLTLTATLGMMVSGPLSDKFGRKPVLKGAALLFFVSALGSAFAPDYTTLVIARMVGGLGVGAALIIAPMYIAEVSPAHLRGRLVSMNQLNIVIGISVAFFSNYLILKLGSSESSWVATLGLEKWQWRWMLGIEALPALLYFIFLFRVPESPRWLVAQGRQSEAKQTLSRINSDEDAERELLQIEEHLKKDEKESNVSLVEKLKNLLHPRLRFVLFIGLSVSVIQQLTGINAVFFYAPMIFEQSGIGTDASFLQAIAVGLTNLVFTFVAIYLIDKVGRKLLLVVGLAGIAISMFSLSHGFGSATYQITPETYQTLPNEIKIPEIQALQGEVFDNDLAFKSKLRETLGEARFIQYESALLTAAITMNKNQILFSIIGFVACFAFSLGPIMWVLFSELFPNYIRGVAISFVGLVNSGVSFGVQLIFPWELANLGNAMTFLLYGMVAVIGLGIIIKWLPETKGLSLEELEDHLVNNR